MPIPSLPHDPREVKLTTVVVRRVGVSLHRGYAYGYPDYPYCSCPDEADGRKDEEIPKTTPFGLGAIGRYERGETGHTTRNKGRY